MTQLTNCQKKGDSAFFKFLMGSASIFVLSGGAGVGKTFLMNHLSNNTMQRYEDACNLMGVSPEFVELAYTATTNKAAEVLEASLGKPVETIHSYLGLKVVENFKTGKTSIEKTDRWKVRKNRIVFIDESSMIDTPLYNIIMESFENCKIIFVGDHAQMSPVNESLSPIYQNVDPDNFIFMHEAIRNAGSPPLMLLCEQLRNTVESGIFHPIKEVPGHIDYLTPAQMKEQIDITFAEETNEARILCYTNSRVKDYNTYIREMRNLPPEFVEGDHLVVARAYYKGNVFLAVERQVEVMSVDPTIHEGGYANVFKDKQPIQYYNIRIKTNLHDNVEVSIPLHPQRLEYAIKALAKQKQWSEYFTLKNAYIDLRNKDACTVYKSQGSTYEEVFIDLGNIGTSFDAEQVARMLFVGASRATTKIYLTGKLPGKYQGREAA